MRFLSSHEENSKRHPETRKERKKKKKPTKSRIKGKHKIVIPICSKISGYLISVARIMLYF